MVQSKTIRIKAGDFLFKYRNIILPAVIISIVIEFQPFHSGFNNRAMETMKDSIAVITVLTGLLFRALVIGFIYIKRGGLNKRVYANELVMQGIFGLCRNPLYLGNMIIFAGIFLAHGNPYVIAFGTSFIFLFYESIIFAEEYFLRSKYGTGYDAYAATVPRWLPEFDRFNSATKDIKFNYKRVLIKDYTSWANAIIALILVKSRESWMFDTADDLRNKLLVYGAVLGFVSLVTGLISLGKKNQLLRGDGQ